MTHNILLLAFIIVSIYKEGILGKFKFRKSISDSDYWLQKPWKWLFEAMILSVSACLITVSLITENTTLLIGSISIGMVAPFARFKANDFMRICHVFFAFTGFGLLVVAFGFDFGRWDITMLIAVVLAAMYVLTRKTKSMVWVLESTLIYLVFWFLNLVV